jgi:pimeloyl-ACP methyl ester carboxylesterase
MSTLPHSKISRFDLAVNGINLHVCQIEPPQPAATAQPYLLFLHDSLGCIDTWRDFPAKMGAATQCPVIIYDRQGYGKSAPFDQAQRPIDYLEREADTLCLLLEKLSLAQVILFGHSDGGSIALIAAAKFPQRIQAIISEGAHVFVDETTIKGIKKAVETYHTTNLKEKLAKYHADKVADVFRAWTETWLSEAYQTWHIKHFLPQINCPCLIIQGEHDEYGGIEQVDTIIEQISAQTERQIIASAGHTPHKEAPEITFELCRAFIQQVLKKI